MVFLFDNISKHEAVDAKYIFFGILPVDKEQHCLVMGDDYQYLENKFIKVRMNFGEKIAACRYVSLYTFTRYRKR